MPFAIQDGGEPLVKAYTACILANIAFLAPGQDRVLEEDGVRPLVHMLQSKYTKNQDRKITLHSTAAVQNLTYKNQQCCQQVLEEGGETALKKLLKVRCRGTMTLRAVMRALPSSCRAALALLLRVRQPLLARGILAFRSTADAVPWAAPGLAAQIGGCSAICRGSTCELAVISQER